jgi:hypothetical protein
MSEQDKGDGASTLPAAPKLQIRFKPQKGDKGKDITPTDAEVGHGENRFHFERSKEPFSVTEEDWLAIKPSGLFELVGEKQSLVITPATATMRSDETMRFAANQQPVTWNASVGSISEDGEYTPPKRTGTFTVTARNEQNEEVEAKVAVTAVLSAHDKADETDAAS